MNENRKRAVIATSIRLISSIINEKLCRCKIKENLESNTLHVSIIPIDKSDKEIATFYLTNKLPDHFIQDSFIKFCDPEDILNNLPILVEGKELTSPCEIFDKVVEFIPEVSEKVKNQISEELKSSVEVQELSYSFQTQKPNLESTTIEWEKAIVEGHATHPMHRTRIGLTLEESKMWSAECEGKVELEFISIPQENVEVFGEFEEKLKGWKPEGEEGRVVIPIHPGQFKTLLKLFPQIKKMSQTKSAFAQTSIRTVSPVDLPYSLKLSLAVQTTSGMRIVSPYSVRNASTINILAKSFAPPGLFIIEEIGSVGSNDTDPEKAKHLGCIVRFDPSFILPNEKHIPCCALVEKFKEKNGEILPLVITAFSLDSKEKRIQFLDNYTRVFFSCFIPPLLKGLAFEAHGQNTMLRISSDNSIVGFSIRDFGGVRVHLETAEKQTGSKIPVKEGSAILASKIEEAYQVFFHAGIQHHLHRLVRALDLHYDCSGWNIIRTNLIPLIKDSNLMTLWFSKSIQVKCLFSMRMEGLYRDYLFTEAPNVLVSECK